MLSGVLLVGLAACSDGGGEPGGSPSPQPSLTSPTDPSPSPSRTAQPALKVVLTDDDGVKAPGIDALARALRRLPAVELTVVAPATNQSGTGSSTTKGRIRSFASSTASGIKATAVRGYPADTIEVALDQLDLRPDLVVSGVNRGNNAGAAVPISGTVGAARAAIARGVPAIAASAAVPIGGGSPDYSVAVDEVVTWVRQHRGELVAGTVTTTTLVNVNTPSCTRGGAVRGPVDVEVAKGDVLPGPSNCKARATRPRTDVGALESGYIAVTRVPAVLATPYPN